MAEPADWPTRGPDEDIWDYIQRTSRWRSPCAHAGEVMRLGDVTADAVAARTGLHQDTVESITRGLSHDLPRSLWVCETVDDLITERWSGLPPGNKLAVALVELRQLIERMHATRGHHEH